jgi:hypothetical protein
MADSLRALRHTTTQLAVGQAIGATRGLPVGRQRSCVRSMIAFAGGIPTLRRRVRENMRLALGHDNGAISATLAGICPTRCRSSTAV